MSRLLPRARRGHGPTPLTEAVHAEVLAVWPEPSSVASAHAGLFVLFPGMIELGPPDVLAADAYPSTRSLRSWHSMASLLVLRLLRKNRVSHATELAAAAGLGLAVGLNVLPKATHATSYSHPMRHEMNTACLTELVRRLRPLGLATGNAGFSLNNFHAIRHHGDHAPLYDHFVDASDTLHIEVDHVTVELTRRTWIPVLLRVGFAEMDLPPEVGSATPPV